MNSKIKTLIMFIVGVIIAKIFLSWWIIIPVLVVLLIAWGYKAMATANQIGPKWAKRLTIIAVTLLAIFYGLMFASHKWPWLTNAINNRQIYLTYKATDLIEPKYPGDLAKSLYKTLMLQIQAEEERQIAILNSLQKKIATNKSLTETDLKSIQAARDSLPRLQTRLANIRMARDSTETKFSFNFPSLPSLSPNMVTAGLIALIFLAIILCFIIKNRKARVALIYLAILSFISLTIWANVGHGPKNASANVQTTPSAQLFSTNFVLASGEKILINRRQLNLAPPRVKTRDEKGIWHCFAPPWPVNDPQCSLLNNTPGRIEIYLELPPGQTLSDYSLAKSLP